MKLASITDRYIARLIFVPLMGTLVLAAMLLILDRMLRLFDFVASEGGPVSVVWRMLANLIPEYLSLGIPIGLMLGILLAFRRLALSNELDIFRAVGLGYGRLLRVPFLYAAVLAAVNLGIVSYVQPWARYGYERLRYELRSGALGASIKVGEFTKLGKKMTLRIEKSADGGRDLSGIFVRAESDRGRSLAVTAERGTFLATDDPNTIILRLTRGTLVHDQPSYRSPRVLAFQSHDLPIDLPKMDQFRGRGGDGRDRELTIPQLAETARSPGTPKQTSNELRAEFHFRLVQVATMFVLPFMAIALAVPPKRSSSALGVFLAIVLIVTQYKIDEYAQDLGERGGVDPLIALWVPFLLFAGLAWWMYHTLAHVPGGQPIGALERWADKAGGAIRRAFRRIGRRRGEPAA